MIEVGDPIRIRAETALAPRFALFERAAFFLGCGERARQAHRQFDDRSGNRHTSVRRKSSASPDPSRDSFDNSKTIVELAAQRGSQGGAIKWFKEFESDRARGELSEPNAVDLVGGDR